MRALKLLFALSMASVISSLEYLDSTTISIQPITSSSILTPPVPLTDIKYNPSTLSASISSYETPDIEPSIRNLRIGVWDAATATWKSSTSVTSAESFAKGYRPTIVLSLDGKGGVLGVSLKSSVIDAGQTRDFGPKVLVRGVVKGRQPSLNKPVVLVEGKLEEPIVEKTMLQKYWWVLLGGVMLLMSTGGGE
ncbi:hypothetical protein BJ878DRAFT_421779 [Calycina marina]|uniref:Uncharacterized protein n=1 Tax=Calycina marina TaxID=1763456 RepID=A0A9P8CEY3_9HELO|nr:hypothetical protein BJ878DRAFT_421779 [Calycina marina]